MLTANPDKDEAITLQEYLEIQRALEQEASEVLPGKFDKCTYELGNITQPLYVCLSCLKNPLNASVICYSCSIACHSTCNLIELFSKRGLKCDCGNSLFRSSCSLFKGKDSVNASNCYDGRSRHNFFGRFCDCDELYDPERADEREMYQCGVCEDWYHDSCIGSLPENSEFDTFICHNCMKTISSDIKSEHSVIIPPNLLGHGVDGPYFCKGDLRESFCKCSECLLLIKQSPLLGFLLSQEHEWEPELDEEASSPLYDTAIQCLKGAMDKVQLDRGLYAFKSFSANLKEYLEQLAGQQKVVTKEDIQRFVENMKSQSKM